MSATWANAIEQVQERGASSNLPLLWTPFVLDHDRRRRWFSSFLLLMLARRIVSRTPSLLRLQQPILRRIVAPTLSQSRTTPLAFRTMATATTTPWVAPNIPFNPVKAPSPFITASGNAFDHLLPGYELVPATSDHPAYAIYTKEIERSPNDDRLYRYVRSLAARGGRRADATSLGDRRLILLPNGMEALLIQDATTDKASASMNVQAGHLDDPEDLQGLAHFCEHLMFMGTEKVRSGWPEARRRTADTSGGRSTPRRTTTPSSLRRTRAPRTPSRAWTRLATSALLLLLLRAALTPP